MKRQFSEILEKRIVSRSFAWIALAIAPIAIFDFVRLLIERDFAVGSLPWLPFLVAQLGTVFLIKDSNILASWLSERNVLQHAPGYRLVQLANFFYTTKTFEMVVMPTITDMREEYFEALSQNRIWKARWVRIRGTWSFFAAMGLDRVFSLVSLCVKVWKSAN